MNKIFAVSLGLLLFALQVPASAQEVDPENIIKYRKAVMTAVKGHNAAIKSIVTGKVPYDKRLGTHISSIETLFSELDDIFPEGSDFGDTAAKDAVWDKPEQFRKTVKKAQQAIAEFKAAATSKSGGELVQAYKRFGKNSCGSCHKQFRKKKQ